MNHTIDHDAVRPDPVMADEHNRRRTRVGLVLLSAVITLTAVIAHLAARGSDSDERSAVGIDGLAIANLSKPLGVVPSADPRVQLPVGGEPPGSPDESDRQPADRNEPVDVPETGDGVFDVADPAVSNLRTSGAVTYTVEVERELPLDVALLAEFVDATLQDPRGWATPDRPLIHVGEDPDYRIRFATPATADDLCAPLDTGGRLSCRNGENVVINAWRWANGASGYTDLTAYRRYVINHEFGHALGHAHVGCPSPGELAPVMLQQTLGLQGCRPNPWVGPPTAQEAVTSSR